MKYENVSDWKAVSLVFEIPDEARQEVTGFFMGSFSLSMLVKR